MTTITFNVSGSIQIVRDTPPPRAVFTVTNGSFVVKGIAPMAYTLPADQKVEVAVAYVDAQGNPVDLPQGNVTWETSDTTILTSTPDTTNDQQCSIVPAGPIGNAQVTCTGTNVDGSTVIATLDVTIVAGNAVTGTIQPVGPPTPIA